MSRLTLKSFHSVKGGVGKSTLATLSALQIAHAHRDERVVLIDMDLTGTSLSDVLPLRAPSWDTAPDIVPLDLPPNGQWRSVEDSREAIRGRGDAENPTLCRAPFLNDYLLYSPVDGSTDADPRGLFWRLEPSPENLFVLPSSALPRDLDRILPVIFDEHQSAFLEARLETLIARILVAGDDGDADAEALRPLHVVLDVPPTIPGLSRAVLSVVLRLTEPGGVQQLADNGGTPRVLGEVATRRGAVFVVVSEDLQDLRAAARWLRLTTDERVRVVVNRSQQRDQDSLREFLKVRLGGGIDPDAPMDARFDEWAPQFGRAIQVPDEDAFKIFRSDDGPAATPALPWVEDV
jgi:hypothetical protein